jgi:hypothetical protein
MEWPLNVVNIKGIQFGNFLITPDTLFWTVGENL